MKAYYNEHDPKAAQWLRELIAAGLIPAGDVDTRDIQEITPHELSGYSQQHFFAGIGGWAIALRLAGWPDDRPVRTGSCPCQPFSAAGKGLAEDDDRHLWPFFRDLLAFGAPTVAFGEQVASKAGRKWLAGIRADLEGLGYAVMLAPWPTPMAGTPAQKGYNEAGNTDSGRKTVALVGWATPTVQDSSNAAAPSQFRRNSLPLNCEATLAIGSPSTSSTAPTAARAVLNPEHSRWLMGYPVAWACCGATAMQSCRRSRRSSSAPTAKQ